MHHCISNNALHKSLQKFFEIEEIPQKLIVSIEDDMQNSLPYSRAEDGRSIVRIPFKISPPLNIGNSRYRATSCSHLIEIRFLKDKDLREKYVSFMQEYISLIHMKLYKDLPREFKSQRPVFISH